MPASTRSMSRRQAEQLTAYTLSDGGAVHSDNGRTATIRCPLVACRMLVEAHAHPSEANADKALKRDLTSHLEHCLGRP